ncbi:unnamed protein product [Tilletia controversa]|nr:unnamed protein product [Tilletia controversa]
MSRRRFTNDKGDIVKGMLHLHHAASQHTALLRAGADMFGKKQEGGKAAAQRPAGTPLGPNLGSSCFRIDLQSGR